MGRSELIDAAESPLLARSRFNPQMASVNMRAGNCILHMLHPMALA
jgi:hypothetical protein